jgi:hypothetical protein
MSAPVSTPTPSSIPTQSTAATVFGHPTSPVAIVVYVIAGVAILAGVVAFGSYLSRRICRCRERRRKRHLLDDGFFDSDKESVCAGERNLEQDGGDPAHSRWLDGLPPVTIADRRPQRMEPSRTRSREDIRRSFDAEDAYTAFPITRDALRGEDRYSAARSVHSSQTHSDHTHSRPSSARSASHEGNPSEGLSSLGPLPTVNRFTASRYKLRAGPIRPLDALPVIHPQSPPSPCGPRSLPSPGMPSLPLPMDLYPRGPRQFGPRPYVANRPAPPVVRQHSVASVNSRPHVATRPAQPLMRQASVATSASSVWSRSTAPSERTRETSRLVKARRNRAIANALYY